MAFQPPFALAEVLGSSTVLLFGHPQSPLAQPRNILLGNTLAAGVSVACVRPPSAVRPGGWAWPWGAPSPSGRPAAASIRGLVPLPVLVGCLLLTGLAAAFSRLKGDDTLDPHHWR
jgi:CBS-domain-containing membrane protein